MIPCDRPKYNQEKRTTSMWTVQKMWTESPGIKLQDST